MKVKDLIAELSKLDPGLEVMCYCEDEDLAGTGGGGDPYRLFDITHVSVVPTIAYRDQNRRPRFTFDTTEGSRPIAYIDVTAQF